MPKPVGTLKVGFFTFTIDELDRLRGQFGHEHEYARDVWRLRRLGVTGVPGGWRLDFRDIQQGWLRAAVKQFLRWRHDCCASLQMRMSASSALVMNGL